MKENHRWLNQIAQLGFLLTMGMSMSADAGFLGFAGDSWKEEVLLHDGTKLIVKRSQSYGGRHEIGQPPPIKEHTITFALPNTNQTITWTSEYGEDIGRANFNLLAVHVLNGTPYIVASPNLCLSYNKWGRPNPPYVFFKYDGQEWQRISLEQFPAALTTINVATYLGGRDVEAMVRLGLVSAKKIEELNSDIRRPEYRSILREPIPGGGQGVCPELVFYKGVWVGPGNSIGKQMMDSKTK